VSLELGPSPDLNLGPHIVSPHRGGGMGGATEQIPVFKGILPSLSSVTQENCVSLYLEETEGGLYLNILLDCCN